MSVTESKIISLYVQYFVVPLMFLVCLLILCWVLLLFEINKVVLLFVTACLYILNSA